MIPSAIIKKMIESFSLKANIEDFGVEAEFSSNDGRSAYDYLLYAANRYGKELFADKDTIYVANEISIRNDEIILEWGKSLVAFESLLSLKRLLSRYDYVGWDVLKGESFTGGASLEDLPIKVGGDKNWTQVSKGGNGKFTGLVSDMSIADTADAKERAKGMLQKNSFWFSQARAKTEGNYKIRPGMRVTLKMIGSKFDGEYIAEEVLHKFNYSDGYTTTVTLKRNMIQGTASTAPSPMQQQQAADAPENSFQVGQDMSGDNFTDEMGSNQVEEQNTPEVMPVPDMLPNEWPIWPLYGYRGNMEDGSFFGFRTNPITGRQRNHEGIDLGAPSGTKVLSALDGVVSKIGFDDTYGNYIIIDHENGQSTMYAHFDNLSPLKEKQAIKKGTVVGFVGNSGASTGPHLHFEYKVNNVAKDPMDTLYGPSPTYLPIRS
jgi:murein DD-endopeptidase MepM/ murein hydrolase activator NlpD